MKLAEERKEERERVMEEMTLRRAEEVRRLRQEVQEEEEAPVSAMREELERGNAEERSALEKGIEEARAALRSLQASLDNDQSKYMKRFHVVQQLPYSPVTSVWSLPFVSHMSLPQTPKRWQ